MSRNHQPKVRLPQLGNVALRTEDSDDWGATDTKFRILFDYEETDRAFSMQPLANQTEVSFNVEQVDEDDDDDSSRQVALSEAKIAFTGKTRFDTDSGYEIEQAEIPQGDAVDFYNDRRLYSFDGSTVRRYDIYEGLEWSINVDEYGNSTWYVDSNGRVIIFTADFDDDSLILISSDGNLQWNKEAFGYDGRPGVTADGDTIYATDIDYQDAEIRAFDYDGNLIESAVYDEDFNGAGHSLSVSSSGDYIFSHCRGGGFLLDNNYNVIKQFGDANYSGARTSPHGKRVVAGDNDTFFHIARGPDNEGVVEKIDSNGDRIWINGDYAAMDEHVDLFYNEDEFFGIDNTAEGKLHALHAGNALGVLDPETGDVIHHFDISGTDYCCAYPGRRHL